MRQRRVAVTLSASPGILPRRKAMAARYAVGLHSQGQQLPVQRTQTTVSTVSQAFPAQRSQTNISQSTQVFPVQRDSTGHAGDTRDLSDESDDDPDVSDEERQVGPGAGRKRTTIVDPARVGSTWATRLSAWRVDPDRDQYAAPKLSVSPLEIQHSLPLFAGLVGLLPALLASIST